MALEWLKRRFQLFLCLENHAFWLTAPPLAQRQPPMWDVAMPERGLARIADGMPTRKTQLIFRDAYNHLMQSGGAYLQD